MKEPRPGVSNLGVARAAACRGCVGKRSREHGVKEVIRCQCFAIGGIGIS